MVERLTEGAAITELLGLSPEQFTARRTQLVKALRAAGETEQAARLAGVRKPATHVWAANHLARERALAVTRLLSAAADLQDAQQKAFAGESGAGERLRRDSEAYQTALDLAVREAARAIREAGRSAAEETLRRLRDVLAGAALGGDDLRRRLGAGTLLEQPPPPGAAAFSFAGTLPEKSLPKPLPAVKRTPAAAVVPAGSQGQQVHRRLVEAKKTADTADQTARRLAQVARRARRRAEAAAAEAASAEREAAEAESRAETASQEAASAAAALGDLRAPV
jgi:hypothetical protein